MINIKIWETPLSWHEKCSLPVAVRVSKTRVLNLHCLLSGAVETQRSNTCACLKGHSQLVHMRIRYHFVANLHNSQEARVKKKVRSACKQTSSNRRPRPHVSGYFLIRNFFFPDTKISASTRYVITAYSYRIRPSTRIWIH